jgi:hypothetical protein
VADDPHHLAMRAVQARVRLYRSRRAFAAAAGLGQRTIDKLEKGVRVTYQPHTRDKIEAALHWVPGSIEVVLAGGEPEIVTDDALRRVLAAWPDLSDRDREAVLSLVTSLVTSLLRQ